MSKDKANPKLSPLCPFLAHGIFLNMKNMKIDFLHVWFTHVHNPKKLLCCWQGCPVARFKVICSTDSPWASSPHQDTPLAHSPALFCRVPPSGGGRRPEELSRQRQVASGHSLPCSQPLLAGWAREDQRSQELLASAAELEVRRSSLSCWKHFIQPGLEWSLGKQQL